MLPNKRLFVIFLLALGLRGMAQWDRVQVDGGVISGTADAANDLHIFQGIPFAAPPVGDLRWREPQPVAKWKGVRDATKPGHACFQNPQGLNAFLTPLAATYEHPYTPEVVDPSEDCLYLNVWAPKAAAHLPVMVWV